MLIAPVHEIVFTDASGAERVIRVRRFTAASYFRVNLAVRAFQRAVGMDPIPEDLRQEIWFWAVIWEACRESYPDVDILGVQAWFDPAAEAHTKVLRQIFCAALYGDIEGPVAVEPAGNPPSISTPLSSA